MRDVKKLTLSEALVGLDAMLKEVNKNPDRPMSVVVTDEFGSPMCFYRMDGASDFTRDMCFRKAYSAAQLGMSTRMFRDGVVSEDMDLSYFNNPDVTMIPGGQVIIPPDPEKETSLEVTINRGQVGATAASGRWSHEDEEIAIVGVRAIQEIVWPNPQTK